MDKMNYGSMKFVSNGADSIVAKAGVDVANNMGCESFNASIEDIVAKALYDYNFKGGDYSTKGHRVPNAMHTKDFAELCDKALYEYYGNLRSEMRGEVDAGWEVNMDEYLEGNADSVFLNMRPDAVGAPDPVSKLVADACGKCNARDMEYVIAPIYAGNVSPASVREIPGSPYAYSTLDDLVNIVNNNLGQIEDALKDNVADGMARVKLGPDAMPALCDIGRYFETNPQAVSKIAGKYSNFAAGYAVGSFADDIKKTRDDYAKQTAQYQASATSAQSVDYSALNRRPQVVLNGTPMDLNAKDYNANVVDLDVDKGLDGSKLAGADKPASAYDKLMRAADASQSDPDDERSNDGVANDVDFT